MRLPPLLLWILPALVLNPGARAQDDKPTDPLRVVTPKPRGIIATAINNRGEVIGFEWRPNQENPEMLDEVPFLARGETMIDLPLLEGYTATFPNDVSDEGLVVGRSSKPGPLGQRVILRNQAFVWDEAGGIRGLGAAEGDWISAATGVSRDGRRVVGYTLGENRQRPCLWERGEGEPERWTVRVLPCETNLSSNRLAISGDGRRVTGTDGSRPCLWTRQESGEWTRDSLGDPGAFAPRAVNDAGLVVGVRHTPEGIDHAVLWTKQDGLVTIPEPEPFARAEARDVNNAGVVVGMIDGPLGSAVGPKAFAYQDGTLRVIDDAGPNFADATSINDRGEVAGIFEEPERTRP